MRFENTFYTVKQEDLTEGQATFAITLNDEHEVFDGHFPDNPITPGVMQMEIVKELLSKIEQKEMNLVSMGNCKFLKILNPKETPTLDVVMKYSVQEDGRYKVSAQMKDEADIYLKLSALYQG